MGLFGWLNWQLGHAHESACLHIQKLSLRTRSLVSSGDPSSSEAHAMLTGTSARHIVYFFACGSLSSRFRSWANIFSVDPLSNVQNCFRFLIFRVHNVDFECGVFNAAHFALCCQLSFAALLEQIWTNILTIRVDCNRTVLHFSVCSVLYAHRYLRVRYCSDLQSFRMEVIDACHRPRMSDKQAFCTSYILFRKDWDAFLETDTVHCFIIKT